MVDPPALSSRALHAVFTQRLESLVPADPARPPKDLGWLDASWSQPEAFIAELHRWREALTGISGVTTPGGRVGLYHDLIRRHVASDRPAYLAYEGRRGWQSLSYGELDRASTQLARHWRTPSGAGEAPLEAGQTLALALPMGRLFLIAYAAALRLGLVVSILPLEGPALLEARLEALAPAAIASSYRHELAVAGRGVPVRLVDARYQGRDDGWMPEHTYTSEEAAAQLFSPLGGDPLTPRPVSAGQLYASALRDSVFVFDGVAGDHISAPGADLLQHQPGLLNACLIGGGTWLHLTLDQLREQPELLAGPSRRSTLAAIVISRQLREILGTVPDLSRWRRWIRNPSEPLDWDAWRDFVEVAQLRERPCINALFDAGHGGALLFSAPRSGAWAINAYVLPSAALAWTLTEAAGEREALGSSGLFVPLGAEDDPPGEIIVARRKTELFFAGQRSPRRDGRTYPSAAVLKALNGVPGVVGATVVPVALGELPYAGRFVLLLFSGDLGGAHGELIARVHALLKARVGEGWVPDKILVYAQYPRLVEGRADHDWCHAQLLSGSLDRKERLGVFKALTQARGALGVLACEGSGAPTQEG